MYQLNQYIQESLAREQLLESKLLGLQRLVEETENASQLGWKALMDEDRLLTRSKSVFIYILKAFDIFPAGLRFSRVS